MLQLLLDEHISPQVARGLRASVRKIAVHALTEWGEGHLLGQDDSACLREAAERSLVFVTYDRRTIPPLLKVWMESGMDHAGVVFVDEKTISPADIGGLVRALAELARAAEDWDWMNRVVFLRR